MSSKCNFSVLSTKMSICLISIWSSRVCFENYFSKSTTEKIWKLAFLQLSITTIVFQFTSFLFSAFICFFFFQLFFSFYFLLKFFLSSQAKKFSKRFTKLLRIFWKSFDWDVTSYSFEMCSEMCAFVIYVTKFCCFPHFQ